MFVMKTTFSVSSAPKNIGIWIRVSTLDQANGDSPEHHLARAKDYASARGWAVKEVYDLAGQTGKAVMQHPEAQRMMRDIERGHITALVFSKLARLSRNLREVQDFGDFFQKHKADLVSLSEAIDTSTAGGRMFFHLLGVFGQWEREETAERVNASVITRAKLGKPINGRAPYGYRWVDRKLLVHPDEAPIRRKAYELFLQYRRKGTVAKFLNAAGYRTRDGKAWRDMQVTRVLIDTSARGIYYFNRVRKHGDWKNVEKPEEEWGKAPCEPIVEKTLWDQVNQIIEEQLKGWKRPGPLPTQVFGNIAHCSCGHKMYVRSRSDKYVCRKCHNKIPMADLEGIFQDELKGFFGSPERIAEHLSNAKQNLSEKEAALSAHEREIAKVRDEMTRTHKLYVEGQITGQGFGEFYRPAEERLNQLQAELPKLQAEVDLLKVNDLSGDAVLAEARTLYDAWPKMSRDEKRKIAESLVEKIVIGQGEIDISFSYTPTSEELCKNQQQLRGPG